MGRRSPLSEDELGMTYIQSAISRGKVDDFILSIHMFCTARDLVEELDNEKRPIKYGRGQRFKSFLIQPEAIDKMYEEPDMPWLYGYAAYMQEFAEKLDKAEIQQFVEKRKKH